MAAAAARLAWMGARRYAVPAIRSGARIAQNYIRQAVARQAPRIGTNIPLRAMGRSAQQARGFSTMRGMGSTAFRASGRGSAAASTSKYWKAGKYAAGGLTAASIANELRPSKKRKFEEIKNRKRINNKKEQLAVGDSGDDIKTKDSFVHTTGNKVWQKYALISGKQQIKYGTTGGLLGAQGRATWGFIRHKTYGDVDADLFNPTGALKRSDNLTQTNWHNNNAGDSSLPYWQTGGDKFQLGFLDRKFIFEKSTFYVEFKNQSSTPVHLEYYVVTYQDSGDSRNIWTDIRDGYSAQTNDSANPIPNINAPSDTNETQMTSMIQDTAGRSAIFRRNWNIIYKHKVRMPEGGVHEWTYTNNANRLINWASLLKRNTGDTDIVTNVDVIAGITYHIIYKIYGEMGDNSNLINTVNVGGITTGDTKVIYRSLYTETYRHCMAAPKIVVDLSTNLPTDLAAVYEKDGGTGNVDNALLEVQP